MKLTTFTSDFTSSKVPKSPFGDKTFEFVNHDVTIPEALELIRNEFILNRNYDFDGSLQLRRTKKDLAPYLNEKLEFVIIDFDNVKNKYSENMIVKYFEDNDYSIGIIPSRSYNGEDSFNLKGILKATGYNTKASIRAVLEEINETLFPYCKIDLTSMNEGALQAPSLSEGVIFHQEGSYVPNYKLKEEIKEHIDLDIADEHSEVIDACLHEYALRGFTVQEVNEERGLIQFSHPSENTPKGYFLFLNSPFYMNHFNKSKSFSIFDALKGKKAVQNFFEEIKRNERIAEFQGSGISEFTKKIKSRYISVEDIGDEFIDKWLDSEGLLKLKSAMGTGKSKVIEKVIEKGTTRRQKILLITNRISVAKDFKQKYGLKMYSDGDYEVGDDLIVQFDSLWRYSLKHFDIIILDEFVSIMLHSRNSMGDYGNLNRVKLMYAMRTKTCMIADAFLFGIEDGLIPTKPKYAIINDYREDLDMFEYPNIKSIVHKIREIALSERGERRKVSVSCTSKALAKAIESIIQSAGLKTMMLSADTLEEEKDDIYKVFEKDGHNAWNVLIYTPTLTVGVSILNNTDHHFHIDESMSADVISSIQMIRRSRKAKSIHYFIKERRRQLETNVENLNREVRNNIETYYKRNNSLLIDVDDYGDFRLSKVGEFINNVEVLYNKLENNHKHSFELLLDHQVNTEIVTVPNIKTEIDINAVKAKNKEAEMAIMKETLNKLTEVDYDDMALDEFDKRTFIVTDKDKMIKLMAEIRKSLQPSVSPDTIKEITELEIQKKFKFVNKLKKLRFFLSKNETEVTNLLSFIVSENTVDKGQLQYFKYIQALKKNGIKLKNKITNVEIQEVNKKLAWGDFKAFLGKIGYSKRGGVYFLDEIHLKYVKYIK